MKRLFLTLMLIGTLSTATHASPSQSPIEFLTKFLFSQEQNLSGEKEPKKSVKPETTWKKRYKHTIKKSKTHPLAQIPLTPYKRMELPKYKDPRELQLTDPRFVEWLNGCIREAKPCILPYHAKEEPPPSKLLKEILKI